MQDQILTVEAAQRLFPGENILKIHSALSAEGFEIIPDGSGWFLQRSRFRLAPADAQALGRCEQAARRLSVWVRSGNEEERFKVLRGAVSIALANANSLDEDDRARISRLAAELDRIKL